MYAYLGRQMEVKYMFLGSWDTVLELFIELESQALVVDADVNIESYTAMIWPAKVGRQYRHAIQVKP